LLITCQSTNRDSGDRPELKTMKWGAKGLVDTQLELRATSRQQQRRWSMMLMEEVRATERELNWERPPDSTECAGQEQGKSSEEARGCEV